MAKSIGVIMDKHASMEDHITSVCRSAQYHLYNIGRIRKYLTREATEQLIHAFITSKLDYCNALFCGLPVKQIKRLQRLQNIAARIVTLTKHLSFTPILHELHWLPVSQRIRFKVLLLVFKCQNNMAPPYLQDLIRLYQPTRALRSAGHSRLEMCLLMTAANNNNPGWAHRGQQTIQTKQNKITTNGPLCATNNTNNEGVKPIPHQPDKGTLQQKVLHSLDGFTAHTGQIPSPNRHLTRRKWLVMRTPCAILHAKSRDGYLVTCNTQTATHLERWRSGKPTGTQARALNETMVGITQRGPRSAEHVAHPLL
ncbi:hypothetical protein BSL78_29072 [Apostichopus japonicus]|uniref:Uncharacterized protein n=1 Tax=Stichopus japonicus TaxID=307972 RepID=A0A2G8JED2_STIJA|nr:hypothetical protein BSL78_29072 [Apostichopus japonicus]